METKRKLLERWEMIEELERRSSADFSRLREKWFTDCFEFLHTLQGEHLWCTNRSIVWQFLEPLSSIGAGEGVLALRQLWQKMCTQFQECMKCVIAYHEAKEFFKNEYPEEVIGKILGYLHDLDKIRLLDRVQEYARNKLSFTTKDILVFLEVSICPDLLDNDGTRLVLLQYLKLAEAALTSPEFAENHPDLWELFLCSSEGAILADKLAASLTRVRLINKLRPFESILETFLRRISPEAFDSNVAIVNAPEISRTDPEDPPSSPRNDPADPPTLCNENRNASEEFRRDGPSSSVPWNADREQEEEILAYMDDTTPNPIIVLSDEEDQMVVDMFEDDNRELDEGMCNKPDVRQATQAIKPVQRMERPRNRSEAEQRGSKRESVRLNGSTSKKPKVNETKEVEEWYKRVFADIQPELDDWYKKVLSLDVFDIPPTEALVEVPTSFRNYQHYLEVFQPLMFEEFKASLQRSFETLKPGHGWKARVHFLLQFGYFHHGRFYEDGITSLKENDLVLLSQDGFQAPNSPHILAKVERPERGNLGLLLKLYFPPASMRAWKMKELLSVEKSVWHIDKLLPITPHLRETQAVLTLRSFPLLKTILLPQPPFCQSSQCLPQTLWKKLRDSYNDSQLNAIETSVKNCPRDGHFLSLVQGPPGTGKTRTTVGIISAIFQSSNGHLARKGSLEKSKRVLVCAQSNSAVDELVSRICNQGLFDSEGRLYKPSVVRVGDDRKLNEASKDVYIDKLVQKQIGIQALRGSPGSCSVDLRSMLDNVAEEMRSLMLEPTEAKATRLKDLQEHQLRLYMELVKAEEREEYFKMSDKDKRNKIKLDVIRDSEIVLTTLNGCGGGGIYATLIYAMEQKDPRASELLFDAVIIDEAAQATEPSTLIPLQLLKSSGTCILIGDPKQLPACVLSLAASEKLFDCSMFERFQRNGYPVTMLNTQYRMHPEIRHFPSLRFYSDKLLDGESILKRGPAPFHRHRLFGPYMFINVPEGQERNDGHGSSGNDQEVEVVFQIARILKERYPNEVTKGKMAVITPYQEQRRLLVEKFAKWSDKSLYHAIEFSTVDSFQGREVDILVFSAVRASSGNLHGGNIGFVADVRRMNVALTRAKLSLWVVGHARTLEKNPDWSALIQDAKNRGLFETVRPSYCRALDR